MFDKIAQYYDAFKSHRDYTQEAQALSALMQSHNPRKPQHVLELGCGTGNLMAELDILGYRTDGLDSSLGMLAIANSKLHADRSELMHGDLTEFKPQKTYDAVILIDGAIGYINPADIPKTIRNISRTVLNGHGMVIIEPWYSVETWKPNLNHLTTHETEEGDKLIRLSRGHDDGEIEFHHLIADATGVQYIQENTKFWLHDYEKIRALLGEDMNVESVDPDDVFKRGLIIGSKTIDHNS